MYALSDWRACFFFSSESKSLKTLGTPYRTGTCAADVVILCLIRAPNNNANFARWSSWYSILLLEMREDGCKVHF